MKRISLFLGAAVIAVLLAALGCVVAASADNSTTIGAGTTVTTSVITTTSDPPSGVSIQVKPITIRTCPSRYATSTTVSGSVTPKQAQPVTVTLQGRSIKGGSWKTADSTETTAGFKFTAVGQCSKHGLWLRAVVATSSGTAVQSNQAIMKVVGSIDLSPIPGNQNGVKLRASSKAPIGIDPLGGGSSIVGDVGPKVRYEVQKKGTTGWKLVQTVSRGNGVAHKYPGCPLCGYTSYYNAEFKVPKTPGIYYARGHFTTTATTAEISTHAYTMTVVR